MWMVSHPGSLMEQFFFFNEDGVLSWVNLFVADGVPSLVMAPEIMKREELQKLQEEILGI